MAWVAYDSISGDVLADGQEQQVRKYAGNDETIIAASESDWRRFTVTAGLGMSANPPRRYPAGIEHL